MGTYFLYAIWLLVIITFGAAMMSGNAIKKIGFNDLQVNDILDIKGARYVVLEYSADGVIVIRGASNAQTYILKVDEEIKFILHIREGNREYVEVKGFKGTVGKDYLNKIKFD